MKVIDLLNEIANGEEIPQLIKWNGYVYDKLGCEYYMLNDRDITLFGDILDTNGKYLNDEVEIIEEDKKIGKIYKFPGLDDDDYAYEDGNRPNNVKINNKMEDLLINKINEIIDYLEENK